MTENVEQAATVDFSHYIVVFAGSFSEAVEAVGATAEIGVKVRVVTSDGRETEVFRNFPLDELVLVNNLDSLAHEAFRRCSSANLVVLGGEQADALESILRPILEEEAAVGLNPVLPLARLDDPTLRDLDTAARWGYFLAGRALGLPAFRAREFMEECIGYENENQDRE